MLASVAAAPGGSQTDAKAQKQIKRREHLAIVQVGRGWANARAVDSMVSPASSAALSSV
jgi:hypothetical protein